MHSPELIFDTHNIGHYYTNIFSIGLTVLSVGCKNNSYTLQNIDVKQFKCVLILLNYLRETKVMNSKFVGVC